MTLARYIQSPDESKDYLVDYTTWLSTGETLVTSVTAVTPVTSPVLTATTAINAALTGVVVTIAGGLVDNEYTIKLTTTTSASQIKEDCIVMSVEAACA